MNADSARRRDTLVACVMYTVLTFALTWPLARGLATDVPSDLGDPLLNMWILAWDAGHLGRGWWSANIFHPHPLSLAYSEHLLPQALQILPVYVLTKNPILCYNLLFLSTFVLSGVGMFLFARELTGDREAALVAGLAFAFAPYRIASLPHLQVLSSAWMAFTLFGLRRYFVTGRTRALAGAGAAWLLQNLSCGYYLFFFSPVVLLYLAWEVTTRGLWSARRVIATLAVLCAIVAALTAPFMLPYLELRRLGFDPRSVREVDRFSADVWAYLTAPANLRVWGSIARGWEQPEGALFPGVTILVLAALGVFSRQSSVVSLQSSVASRKSPVRSLQSSVDRVLTVLLALAIVVFVALLFGWSLRLPGLRITSASRVGFVTIGLTLALFAVSRDARATARRWMSTPAGLFSLVTLLAIAMSFGRHVMSRGRLVLDAGPYALFYRFVPGFDGVRVPARFGMIVAFGLATLAACGLAALSRGLIRIRPVSDTYQTRIRPLTWITGLLIVIEFIAVPIPINGNSTVYTQRELAPLPGRIVLGPDAPAVYRFIADLPTATAVLELPLGEPAFDLRYVLYSTLHWKPLVNGYSGGFPADYTLLTQSLVDVFERPDRAWSAIRDSRATHVVVHEAHYATDRGQRLSRWLRDRGAHEVATFGADRVFELPSAIRNP